MKYAALPRKDVLKLLEDGSLVVLTRPNDLKHKIWGFFYSLMERICPELLLLLHINLPSR